MLHEKQLATTVQQFYTKPTTYSAEMLYEKTTGNYSAEVLQETNYSAEMLHEK